jgi:hypothetical protein
MPSTLALDRLRGRRPAQDRRRGDAARPLHLPSRPGLLLEEQVERCLQHLLHRGPRDGVGEPLASRLQLRDHLLADVEVDPALVGGERDDLVAPDDEPTASPIREF